MHCSSVAPECCCWFHVRLLFAGGSRRFRGLHVVRTQSHGYHCASTLCDHGAWAAAPAPWTQSPSLRRRPFKLRFVRFPHISSCSTRLAVQQPSLLVWCSAPRRCHGVYLYRGRHCAVDGTHLSHEARSRDPRADPIAKSNQQSSAEPGRQRTSHRSRHSRPERPGRRSEGDPPRGGSAASPMPRSSGGTARCAHTRALTSARRFSFSWAPDKAP